MTRQGDIEPNVEAFGSKCRVTGDTEEISDDPDITNDLPENQCSTIKLKADAEQKCNTLRTGMFKGWLPTFY